MSPGPLPLREAELASLWLLGRVPPAILPWPLLRAGRAGRGPGPDVRDAAFALPAGVALAGDVEVHLRRSDYRRHGHERDPAYDRVILHLVWEDDARADAGPHRPRLAASESGGATGAAAPTVAVGPALNRDPGRLRRLLARGPSGHEPCGGASAGRGVGATVALVRAEGRRRLAERSWRAAAVAAERGWDGAWQLLLERALAASAGRHHEPPAERARLSAAIEAGLGPPPLRQLAAAASSPAALIAALRANGTLGAGRAAEVGWNAALPLLAALSASYGDPDLAQRTARLVDAWPPPRPYGRTRALHQLLGAPQPREQQGALWAQGLLHLQDLWCSRGGCGACPLSAAESVVAPAG